MTPVSVNIRAFGAVEVRPMRVCEDDCSKKKVLVGEGKVR